MRGARGGRWVRFTAPDGSDFDELSAPGTDFTKPVITGKMAMTEFGALQSIRQPSRSDIWCCEICRKVRGNGI
jgi:hypothetical protein